MSSPRIAPSPLPRSPSAVTDDFQALPPSAFPGVLNSASADPVRASLVSALTICVLLIFSLSLVVWTQRLAGLRCPDCPAPECDGNSTGTDAGVKAGGIEEALLGEGIAFVIVTIVLCIFGAHLMIKYSIVVFPTCIVYIFLGILVGSVLRVIGAAKTASYALPNTQQFLLFILPPIIFEAGYTLNKLYFFRNLLVTMLFAIIGTFISTMVFGMGLFGLGLLGAGFYFRLWEALAFGSLISAVDPVATLAIFNALKVPHNLHSLVFGESVLNDMVSIVLYKGFCSFGETTSEHTSIVKAIFSFVLSFVVLSFGSTLVGIVTSLITALILKHISLSNTPTLELTFFILMAYLPYFICEGLDMSGIVGIFVSGIALSHYGQPNLNQLSRVSAQQITKMFAFIAETFAFVYLGFALVVFNHHWEGLTIFWAILLILLGRALNVFPLSFVVNRIQPKRIPGKYQFVMFYAGLRGAIAFALSLNFPVAEGETRRTVISTTLAVILFTIVVLGGGTLPLLRVLRVHDDDVGPSAVAHNFDTHMDSSSDLSEGSAHSDGGAEGQVPATSTVDGEDEHAVRDFSEYENEQLSMMSRIDRDFLQPWLVMPREPNQEGLGRNCERQGSATRGDGSRDESRDPLSADYDRSEL